MTRAVSHPGSRLAAVIVVAVLTGGCAGDGSDSDAVPGSERSGDAGSADTASPASPGPTVPAPPAGPLAGKVVVLDPGHQLGNRHHGARINAPVDAGGFEKPCNTTGTATSSGHPEATFTWRVATRLRAQLRALGARVVMTRATNSDDAWGPCIDERGSIGNPDEAGPVADVRVSIHADGVISQDAHGFHVIRPGVLDGWTDDISRASRGVAIACRDALVAGGFSTANYAGEAGIDVRTDLGTLNHSDVPVVMLELGNMRNDDDAALMENDAGELRYARAVLAGLRTWLTR